ncbi:MAG: alkaline phosphatase family protein [Acidimicrobiia bacterium]
MPGNVLFVTLDQWRADALGILAAGRTPIQTPNLDRLAARSTTFASHYVQMAPCGPSRASLHTGMYGMNHRSVLNGTPLDARFTNVALEARAAGYDPVLFGYTDTSVDPRTVAAGDPRLTTYEGVLPGFRPELLLVETLEPWGAWLAEHGYDVPANVRDIYEPDRWYPGAADHASSWAPTRYAAEHSEAAFAVERFGEWLHRQEGEWFAHVAFIRPHPPFVAPAPYHDQYDPADVPMPVRAATRATEAEQHPGLGVILSVPEITIGDDERELRQLRATYYGMVSEVDAQVGRLLDQLETAGVLDDTLIVVTSDHGEMLGDHWLLQKLGWWDSSYHVPLIVHDPRAAANGTRGTVIDEFTENIDVMPTILEWIGHEVPLQCDGTSVLPWVHGHTPGRWRDAVHWEWDFRDPVAHMAEDAFGITMEECAIAVIRDRHGKYVHFAAQEPIFFDLDADPEQLHNVAHTSPKTLEYAQRMLSWRLRHADRTLTGTILTGVGPVTRRDPR